MSAFINYIKNHFENSSMSERAFAEHIDIPHSTFRSWLDDRASEPKIDTVERIIKRLGGSFDRALPGWKPDINLIKAHAQPVKLHGEVAAGAASYSQSPVEDEDVLENTYRDSDIHRFTTGEIAHVRVKGDSMEPQYPNGSLLAGSPPKVKKELIPHGTPVVLIDRFGDTTFKEFQYNRQYKRIIALPINPAYETQIYKLDDVEVQLIIIGITMAVNGPRHAYIDGGLGMTMAEPEESEK